MSSLSAVGRFAAAHNKDRKSLCRFTFADGRQCRTPRSPGHPPFCFDHARKDSQARAADKLARELSYFFSGPYLSACDLSAALGRLMAGVARGDIKPRSARTLAYLAQTLVQTIHLAEDEYINAFDTDAWRKSVRNSVKGNHDYLFPPANRPRIRLPNQPQLLNRPHRRTLPCLRRAPNSSTMYWPVGTCPGPAGRPVTPLPPTTSPHPQPCLRRPDLPPFTLPPDAVSPLLRRHSPQRLQVPRPSNPQPEHNTLLNHHPNPSHRSPLHHLPRRRSLGQPLVLKQVRPAFQFWRLFPRGSRERLPVLAPLNSFIINT